jgi:hypothetical protein
MCTRFSPRRWKRKSCLILRITIFWVNHRELSEKIGDSRTMSLLYRVFVLAFLDLSKAFDRVWREGLSFLSLMAKWYPR